LESGEANVDGAVELIERRVVTRIDAATAELEALGVSRAKIDGYFEMMPRRYFAGHSPRQIARHARVVLGLGENKMLAMATREFRGGFTELILSTQDAHGLYSNVAGVLTANSINILGAHVYSTHAGLALEVYRVSTPNGGEAERQMVWEKFETDLTRVLKAETDVESLLSRRGTPLGSTAPPSPKAASVSVSNDESDFYTIVDVAANDRLGLLHELTAAWRPGRSKPTPAISRGSSPTSRRWALPSSPRSGASI
jgi:UTP:GlnB (protein PII) uridylyltransferase